MSDYNEAKLEILEALEELGRFYDDTSRGFCLTRMASRADCKKREGRVSLVIIPNKEHTSLGRKRKHRSSTGPA